MKAYLPKHQMQPFEPAQKTSVTFLCDGRQWGERGEFCGPPEVALVKAEAHVSALVRAGVWPGGRWVLRIDRGKSREVTVLGAAQ